MGQVLGDPDLAFGSVFHFFSRARAYSSDREGSIYPSLFGAIIKRHFLCKELFIFTDETVPL